MVAASCPACGHHCTHSLQVMQGRELIALYQSALGIDVSQTLANAGALHLLRCDACDLRFYTPAVMGDSAFYEQLQRFDWYYQDDKPEYHCASQYVSAGSRVLEVGCGKGAFRAFLPTQVDYTGLEFNDMAIQKGRSAGLHIEKAFVQDFAASAPGLFDVVCSFQVLEHVADVAGFVDACASLLKTGGTLMLAVPCEDSFLALDQVGVLNMPPHHVNRWTDRALKSLADRLGLDVMTVWHEPLAPYHDDWYRTVLARDWFVRHGIIASGTSVPRKFVERLVGWLLRRAGVRDFFARLGSARFEFAGRGHSVMLVGRKRASSQLQAA